MTVTLASKLRAGDIAVVGATTSHLVLAVAQAAGNVRVITDAGSFDLHPQQRVRVV